MDIAAVQRVGRELIDTMVQAGFVKSTMPVQTTLCLAEEAGEAVQAIRRMLGMARTPGTMEAVRTELADVVIAAAVCAQANGVNLNRAVVKRVQEVMERPVRATGTPCEALAGEPDPPEKSSGYWPATPGRPPIAVVPCLVGGCLRPLGGRACNPTEPCVISESSPVDG